MKTKCFMVYKKNKDSSIEKMICVAYEEQAKKHVDGLMSSREDSGLADCTYYYDRYEIDLDEDLASIN